MFKANSCPNYFYRHCSLSCQLCTFMYLLRYADLPIYVTFISKLWIIHWGGIRFD